MPHCQEKHSRSALAKLLSKVGLITPEVAERAATESKEEELVSWLGSRRLLDEMQALKVLSLELGIEHIEELNIDSREVLNLVNQFQVSTEQWRTAKACPLRQEDDELIVAFANPLDNEARALLEFKLGKKIRVAIAPENRILELLPSGSAGAQNSALKSLVREATEAEVSTIEEEIQQNVQLENNHNAPPVIRLVDTIFAEAIHRGASDLHIIPEKSQLEIKVRVDGILQHVLSVPYALRNAVTSRMKLLAGMDIAERRRSQDGRMRIQVSGTKHDLRVSTMLTCHGEKIVIRVLATSTSPTSFEALGMSASMQEELCKALRGSSKSILVSGPTGSGKTSTLYSCLLHLRTGERNLVSIEDPVEYQIEGISQVQVNNKIGITFADGLKTILRQDPDVIMVGEIRDQDTASIALQCAQTGHLVLSTIHTNSAASVITRLRDLGVPVYLITSSLEYVIAQRLVRRFCPVCKGKQIARMPLAEAASESSCTHCGGSGYKGRIAIYSLLHLNQEVCKGIRAQCSDEEIEQIAMHHGFNTLPQAALELVRDGLTSIEEVERVLGPLPDSDSKALHSPNARKNLVLAA